MLCRIWRKAKKSEAELNTRILRRPKSDEPGKNGWWCYKMTWRVAAICALVKWVKRVQGVIAVSTFSKWITVRQMSRAASFPSKATALHWLVVVSREFSIGQLEMVVVHCCKLPLSLGRCSSNTFFTRMAVEKQIKNISVNFCKCHYNQTPLVALLEGIEVADFPPARCYGSTAVRHWGKSQLEVGQIKALFNFNFQLLHFTLPHLTDRPGEKCNFIVHRFIFRVPDGGDRMDAPEVASGCFLLLDAGASSSSLSCFWVFGTRASLARAGVKCVGSNKRNDKFFVTRQ